MDFAALLKLVQENPIVAALLGSALGLVGGLAWRFVKKGDTVVIDKLMHTELLQKHPDLADAVFAINDFIMLGVSTAFSTVVAEAKADGSWNPKKGQEVKDKVIALTALAMKGVRAIAQASAVSKPKPPTGKVRPNSEYCLRKLVIWLPARFEITRSGFAARISSSSAEKSVASVGTSLSAANWPPLASMKRLATRRRS